MVCDAVLQNFAGHAFNAKMLCNGDLVGMVNPQKPNWEMNETVVSSIAFLRSSALIRFLRLSSIRRRMLSPFLVLTKLQYGGEEVWQKRWNTLRSDR